MSNILCDEVFISISISEMNELDMVPCINILYNNIAEGMDNYEWDIITMFKIYDSYIQNSLSGCPICYCPICTYERTIDFEKYKDKIDIIKKTVYIMWFMKLITSSHIINRVKKFISSQEGKSIKNKIDDYYNFLYLYGIGYEDNIWMEKEHYYKKLFYIPYMLSSIGISLDHYLFRDLTYFNDMIAGNPMASNGWFKESLDNAIEMGAFD
jgi:hypothetical protein